MAHIVEFRVGDLAGSRKVYSQRLNRDINIFFGKNGSGKTSLLKIFHSAMSLDARFLKNVPFKSATVKVYSLFYKRIFTEYFRKKEEPQQYELIYHPDVAGPIYERARLSRAAYGEATPHVRWSLSPRRKIKGSWEHDYLPISRLYSGMTAQASREAIYSEEDFDLRYAEALQTLWSRYAADVSKVVREAQETGLAKILRAVLSKSNRRPSSSNAIQVKDAYARVSAFLKRQPRFRAALGSSAAFSRKYSADPQLQSVVKDIDEVEGKIELATKPRDELRTFIESMFIGGKVMKFGEKGIEVQVGKTNIGLPTLSSGEKHLLLILLSTLRTGGNTILIDEPELSMHVDWQRVLIKIMRQLNPEAQIIVATHSPEIMADVPEDKIFRL